MFLHHHLNSKILQKEHPQVYQDFFSHYPLIVSCPSVLLWTPIYSIGIGGLGISSKLPGRHYIGIKKYENGNGDLIRFIGKRNYFPERNIFKETEPSAYWNDKVKKIYENFLKKKGVREKIEIEILEEGPIARGWHTTQAVVTALSCGIFLWYKFCTKEDIKKWKKMETEKLLKEKEFLEIVKLSWKAASYAIETFDDGYAILTSLVDSQYPIVFYHEKDPAYFDQYKDFGIDDPRSYYNFGEKMAWRTVRLNELFNNLPQESHWALEYAILYNGSECPLRYIYKAQIKYDERLTYLAQFIKETFEKTLPKDFKEAPNFLQPSYSEKESPGMVLFKKYREASVVLSSEFVKHFYELYRTGYVFDKIQEFFKGINLCESFAKILGQVISQVDNVCSILTRNARRLNELGAGVKLISEGITGDILVAGSYNTVRRIIEKSQKEVEELTGQSLYCEYASWCDGQESEGVKIEQFLPENVYSSFVVPGAYTIKTLIKNGRTETFLLSREEFKKRINEFDLLGDLEENKIYIKGKALSSRDLHSTKATLRILKKFFEKETIRLEASEFSDVIYRDRNQMDSKIVRPLVKAFKKYLGKKIDFAVSGGLASNFSLIFKPDGLNIGLIEKRN
ncbi:MAG: hypothetical protein AB1465_04215 [Patescibacteria group bacterium]